MSPNCYYYRNRSEGWYSPVHLAARPGSLSISIVSCINQITKISTILHPSGSFFFWSICTCSTFFNRPELFAFCPPKPLCLVCALGRNTSSAVYYRSICTLHTYINSTWEQSEKHPWRASLHASSRINPIYQQMNGDTVYCVTILEHNVWRKLMSRSKSSMLRKTP